MKKDQIQKIIEWELNRIARYIAYTCMVAIVLFWNLYYQASYPFAISIILSICLSIFSMAVLSYIFANKKKRVAVSNLCKTSYKIENGFINALEIYNKELEFNKVKIKISETQLNIVNDDQNIFVDLDKCVISKCRYSGIQSSIMSIVDTGIGNMPQTYEKSFYNIISIDNFDCLYLTFNNLSEFGSLIISEK